MLLLVVRAGNESKPIWPLNVPDLLYASLFFFYGYGLYARRGLISRLKGTGCLAALWAIATLAFLVNVVLVAARAEASGQGGGWRDFRGSVADWDSILRGVGSLVQRRVSRLVRAAPPVIPWVGSLAGGLVVLDIHHPLAGCDLPNVLSGPPRPAGPAGIPDRLRLERRDEVSGRVHCDHRHWAGDLPVPGQVRAPWDLVERQEGGELVPVRPIALRVAGRPCRMSARPLTVDAPMTLIPMLRRFVGSIQHTNDVRTPRTTVEKLPELSILLPMTGC